MGIWELTIFVIAGDKGVTVCFIIAAVESLRSFSESPQKDARLSFAILQGMSNYDY